MAFFLNAGTSAKLLGGAWKLARQPWTTAGAGKATWESLHWSMMGNQIMLPLVAYTASKAQPGEALASFGSETLGWSTHGVLSLATTGLLHLVPGFGMLPVGARAAIGSFVAALPNAKVVEGMHKGFTLMNSAERRIQRLETGGDYQDSETAAALRMAAVRDMSSTMGARRRYLGNEALYFHA